MLTIRQHTALVDIFLESEKTSSRLMCGLRSGFNH